MSRDSGRNGVEDRIIGHIDAWRATGRDYVVPTVSKRRCRYVWGVVVVSNERTGREESTSGWVRVMS